MNFDNRELRNALGTFATGVTVVTTRLSETVAVGVTVNSFTSVSMEPPLVLVCLDKRTKLLNQFINGDGFAINVLSESQQQISNDFAYQIDDNCHGHPYETGLHGSPVLSGCLANLDCALETSHDAGDHVILIGRVLKLRHREGNPLLFYKGSYAQVLNEAPVE